MQKNNKEMKRPTHCQGRRKTGLGIGEQKRQHQLRKGRQQTMRRKRRRRLLAGARSFSSLILIINFIFLLYDTCSLSSLPILFVFRIIVFHLWAVWRWKFAMFWIPLYTWSTLPHHHFRTRLEFTKSANLVTETIYILFGNPLIDHHYSLLKWISFSVTILPHPTLGSFLRVFYCPSY